MGRRSEQPTIVFLHIGKTGGLTFRRILRRQFPASHVMELKTPLGPARQRREGTAAYFASLPEAERARPRLIMGHTTFGLHELIPRPSTYVTLLRDPLKLNVSLYHYIRSNPNHFLHDEVIARNLSLEEFLRSGIALETDNSQVRALSGDTTAGFGACTERMLEHAKRNVEERISVVGFTEHYEESALLLRRTFGWSNVYFVPLNVGKGRRDPLPASTLELIREQNRLDLELYRWAERRLEDEIAADPSFAVELRRFQRANRLYRPWGHLTYTYPKLLRDRLLGQPTASAVATPGR